MHSVKEELVYEKVRDTILDDVVRRDKAVNQTQTHIWSRC